MNKKIVVYIVIFVLFFFIAKQTKGSSKMRKNVSDLKPSQFIIDYIKRKEGKELAYYNDPSGYCTVGYGHLVYKRNCATGLLGKRISEKEAERILMDDIKNRAERFIKLYVKNPINQNQYDSLVSFVFNIGGGNFKRSSVLAYINKNDFEKAATKFILWNKSGGKILRGLTIRRNFEAENFNS